MGHQNRVLITLEHCIEIKYEYLTANTGVPERKQRHNQTT